MQHLVIVAIAIGNNGIDSESMSASGVYEYDGMSDADKQALIDELKSQADAEYGDNYGGSCVGYIVHTTLVRLPKQPTLAIDHGETAFEDAGFELSTQKD
jgi:hypothetical protein